MRISRTGKITVFTGASAMGQGLSTALAQIAASQLGVPVADVRVVAGSMSDAKLAILVARIATVDSISFASVSSVVESDSSEASPASSSPLP